MKSKFHENLTRIRKQRGFTQVQMAQMLEIPRSTYSNYETGNRSPDLEALERISDVLGCSLDQLFGRAVTPTWTDVLREPSTTYHTKGKRKARKHRSLQKKLAIGVQSFRRIRERGSYYVDKTLMIEEFLDSMYQVTLITRPRRFGKSMNMSMIAEFLDCTKQSQELFEETDISESYVMDERNTYPTISVSFSNVKGDTASVMLLRLRGVLEAEYRRYEEIIRDGKLSESERKQFEKVYETLQSESTSEEIRAAISNALIVLCTTLEMYYGKKVFLLIDEYDTPFIAANAGGYYDELRDTLALMLSSALKGNEALEKAMLTGIQRVAKENIFSGLNNLSVCTVKDEDYSEYFGFTEDETRELLAYYGMELSEEVKNMYDGYLFGSTEVYNPWSVTCYAARKELESYWVNTSENSILKNAMEQRGDSFARDYRKLIEEGSLTARVELAAAYYEQPGDDVLWGLLINAGMLTIKEKRDEDTYQLRIPNYEVRKVFQELTAFYLNLEEGHIFMMLRNLRIEDMNEFAAGYQRILLELPSYHDLMSENSYHMMMLGMCAFMYRYYNVESNRESGTGRSDIILRAKKQELANMVLEFKYTRDESQDLDELAMDAIQQIKERKYDAGLGGRVYYIGLAHCGKKVSVRWEISPSILTFY